MRSGMRFCRSPIRGFVFSCLLVALAGCGGERDEAAAAGEHGGTLTVLAASSLTDAFGELSNTFEEQNPGGEVRTSFAASSALLAQIQQGAPADVFASADLQKMDAAVEDGLVAGEPETFVRNREVVIVPRPNPADIRSFRDLSKPGIRLVLAQDEVPAAEYAEDILDNAAEDPEYGPEFRQAVLINIVSREADARASVNRAVVGDADATFGYASDVTPDIRDRVRVVPIPENLNVIATYPIAVLEESQNKALAKEWIELVTSDEGQRVLEKWGFEPVAKGP
jgi:molybdate transport system substrate-binding protein